MPSIGVVVPTHSGTALLEVCLGAVERQTIFESLNVVLLADSAALATAEVAHRFAERHTNVRVIGEPDLRAGRSRNLGIDASAGSDYVVFLDSSDLIAEDALEVLREAACSRADVVLGRGGDLPLATRWIWAGGFGDGSRRLGCVAEAPEIVHHPNPASKLFSRHFIAAHDLRFLEQGDPDGAAFTVSALAFARTIQLVDHQVHRPGATAGAGTPAGSVVDDEVPLWNRLAVVEHLFDRTQAKAKALGTWAQVQAFSVRYMQECLLDAAEIISRERLDEFFGRALRVFQATDTSVISANTRDTRSRIGFAALIAGDVDLFASAGSSAYGLTVVDGQLFVDAPVSGRARSLLRCEPMLATADFITEDDSHVVIHGRCSPGGYRPGTRPQLSLCLGAGGPQAYTAPARERPDLTRADGRGVAFSAAIPSSALSATTQSLTLIWRTAQGSAEVGITPGPGWLKAGHPVHLGASTVMTWVEGRDSVEPTGRAQIKCNRGGTALRRGEAARLDLRQVASRDPMWKLVLLQRASRIGRRGDVWLLGDRGEQIGDNAWHLFRYLRDRPEGKHAWYVLDDASSDWERAQESGHIVARGSRQHDLLAASATVLISSFDIDSYLLPQRWDRSFYNRNITWRAGSRRVFLQHGVIGNDVSAALHRSRTALDLFITSSDEERRFVQQRTEYTHHVVTTGMPRYDALTPKRVDRRILCMPTWRRNLTNPSYMRRSTSGPNPSFLGSRYLQFWRSLLEDEAFVESLRDLGFRLELVLHPEMAEHYPVFKAMENDVVVVADSRRDIQDAIRECSVFVTDYSSTSFDAAYLGVPVVYAPFDEEDFFSEQYERGYFSAGRDGFGPVVKTAADLADVVLRYVKNGCDREAEYEGRAKAFFAHRDQLNAQRVLEMIQAIL